MKYRISLLNTLFLFGQAVVSLAASESSSKNPRQVSSRTFQGVTGLPRQDPVPECGGVAEEIQRLIQLGIESVPKTNETDIIILVGLSGSGKSTLTQFVANSSNTLRAVCNLGECTLIDDSGSIGGNPVSQTFIPNLVVENITGTPFFDMPGFDDNRNETTEIANSLFIQQIIAGAERMKIIIVQRQESLTNADRITFVRLIKNLMKLIRAPEKFANSIALIATATDYLELDENLRGRFVNFIQNYTSSADSLFTPEEKPIALGILKILSETETPDSIFDPKYFSYFKKPFASGPLIDDPVFLETKNNISTLIMEKLEFAQFNSTTDFGLPLTDSAASLLKSTATCISKSVSIAMDELSVFLNSHIIAELNNLNSMTDEDIETFSSLLTNLTSIDYGFANEEGKEVEYYLICLRDVVSSIDAEPNHPTLNKLEEYAKMFKVIADIGIEVTVEPKLWVLPLKSSTESAASVLKSTATETSTSVSKEMNELSVFLNSHIIAEMKNINSMTDEDIETFSSLLTNLTSIDYGFANEEGKEVEYYLMCLRDVVSSIDAEPNHPTLDKLDENIKIFLFIADIGIEFTVEPKLWVEPLKNLLPNVTKNLEEIANTAQLLTIDEIQQIASEVSKKILQKFDLLSSEAKITALEGMVTNLDDIGKSIDQRVSDTSNNLVEFLTTYEDDLTTLNESKIQIVQKKLMALFAIFSKTSEFNWRLQDWKSPVTEKILLSMQIELNVLQFTNLLKTDLSTYQIQSNKEGNLREWWSDNKEISAATFPELWTKIDKEGFFATKQFTQEDMSSIILPSDTYKSSLESLLNTYFNLVSCSEGTAENAIVVANFLSMKQALSCLPPSTSRKSISLLAMDTLYVDSSVTGLQYTTNLQITLIAPTIFSESSAVMDLTGSTGGDGGDGSNGNQGNPAGNFYFAYDHFDTRSSAKSVNVKLDGGKGGTGGLGLKGGIGPTGDKKSFSAATDCFAWQGGDIQVRVDPSRCGSQTRSGMCHAGSNGVEVWIDGTEGGRGEAGKNGGDGGPGGPAGCQTIYDFGLKRNHTEYGIKGLPGMGGSGGPGGSGGRQGDDLVVRVDDTCCRGTFEYYCTERGRRTVQSNIFRDYEGPLGQNGNQDTRDVAPQQPNYGTFNATIQGYLERAKTMTDNVYIGAKLSSFVTKLQEGL